MDELIDRGMAEFEGFRFDVEVRRLLRRDVTGEWVPVAVGSRALDVLSVLLRQPGALVTKDAIMRQVWPGTAVEANNLTVQITALRKVLDGGRGSDSCIQTVTGRGYRFVAALTRLETASGERTPPGAGDPGQRPLPVAATALRGTRAAGEDEPQVGSVTPSDPSPNAGTRPTAGQEARDDKRLEPRPPGRRQLTVMVCDVVGSAALSVHLDLEDLRAVTTACHRCCTDIIQQHHGYVAGYSADGVVAYFGYPQAGEHDVEGAVRAGLALAEAVPKLATGAGLPLHVGAGIATGMVVTADHGGPGATQTVTAVGTPPPWPLGCKDWPPPIRSLSLTRPAACLAMRSN
jgi:DNA-binding winged helix-turn-helix (wHTH) protein